MQPSALPQHRAHASGFRLRMWGLLWLGLLITINLPSLLHCSFAWRGAGDPGCNAHLPKQLIDVGVTLAALLGCTVLGLPRLPAGGRARAVGVAALVVVAAVITVMTGGLVDAVLNGGQFRPPSLYTVQIMVTHALCVVVAAAYLQQSRQRLSSAARLQQERQSLEAQIDAARLSLLQAQVEPHFLFNTLAHLRRLAQTDPEAARAMLADLLQYLGEALPELREAESTLERELRLVRAYLALHQRRMGETRLRFDFEVEPGLAQARLPSTALLTLAENAIKHGIAPLVTGGQIHVRARRAADGLLLEVADTGRGMGESSGHGTGLATLRARLKALYGDEGQLQLSVNQPRGLIVQLRLPLQEGA